MLRAMLALALLACVDTPTSEGARPVLSGDGFFGRPFPSDDRLVDGHPDLAGFPGEGDYPLIDDYLATAAELDGFGNNSPIWVQFADALDTSLLPSPSDSTQLASPVLLLDVDRDSPHRGELVPVTFEYREEETSWTPANFLAVAPVFGFPLRPSTTYALVFRSPLVKAGTWVPDWSDEGGLRPVEETLLALGITRDEPTLVVSFTTQDPVGETARIARAIHDEIGRVRLEPVVEHTYDGDGYRLYEGWATVPVWQHGDRPYGEVGGGFRFGADGSPEVAFWERTRFALSIPDEDPPEGGWPVVLYAHGTGGSYRSFCGGSPDDEAVVLGREGLAVFGISQPLHGDRKTDDTNEELHSFNYLNPEASRANFRQGALDQVYLARLLAEADNVFWADDGTEIRLDADRVAYFGHSQGGLVGAIAAPYLSDDVVAVGFSGAGGGLAMTIMQRKDPLDFAAVIEALLEFDEDEHLSTFHPAIGLIQMLVEATDPLNYAPWWFAEEPGWSASPVPVLLTEGLVDAYTPADTTEALAVAGRVPIVGAAAHEPDAMKLRSLEPSELPTADNVLDWNDAPITAGLGQFEEDGHYAIYENREAKRMYRDYLATALDGKATIED
jgi:pimeloyl-ACP methyl ester carboxylesterase